MVKKLYLFLVFGAVIAALVSCRSVRREAFEKATAVVTRPKASPTARPTFFSNLPYVSSESTPTLYPDAGQSATPSTTPSCTRAAPSVTPSPTATPTPAWPETLEQPGRSKLGIHVQNNNTPLIMEFVRRVKPRVMKGVDDLGFLTEVKQVSPQTVTIGRFSDVSVNMEGDPVQEARQLVSQYLGRYQEFPGVDYWEGVNEPVPNGRMDWFAAFEAERVRVMAEHGLKCAIGNFSTGVPEWDDFAAFLPAIRAAKQYGGVLALHEYNAPTMYQSVGSGLPGREPVANRGALTLRYRWWYEDFIIPRGLVIPLVITECGIDGGIANHPGPDGLGWQDFVDYWRAQGLHPDGKTEYIRQLGWYDSELQKDSYVIGATIFTAGSASEQWRSFEIHDMIYALAFYLASLK